MNPMLQVVINGVLLLVMCAYIVIWEREGLYPILVLLIPAGTIAVFEGIKDLFENREK